MRNGVVLVFVWTTILFSCQTKLSPKDWPSFLSNPDNGFIVTSVDNTLNTTFIYQPSEWLVYKELGKRNDNDSIYQATLKNYKKYHYFLLSLSVGGRELTHNVGNQELYTVLRSQLCFHLQDHVFATVGEDTLRLVDYQVANTYGQSLATQLLIAFEKREIAGSELVVHWDGLALERKPCLARFDIEKLKKLPEIQQD